MAGNIRLENLAIYPEVCPINNMVDISVLATNYGDTPGTRTIRCQYKKKEVSMVTVIFSGSVSVQAVSGGLVTITVTQPDQTTQAVTCHTLDDKTFSVEYSAIPGDYTLKARVEADALYKAAESDEVPFTIGKESRTITVTVTPK